MWERTLSQKSVRLFCEQKVIDEAKADAYVYGYELLISSVVSVLLGTGNFFKVLLLLLKAFFA